MLYTPQEFCLLSYHIVYAPIRPQTLTFTDNKPFSAGTRAPGSSDSPTEADDPDEDVDNNDDKGGLSNGAILGIVLGTIAVIAFAVIYIVSKYKIKKTTSNNQPVAPLAPVTVTNAPPTSYFAHGRESGIPIHATRIEMPPPIYDQAQASAPPFNPYYKGGSIKRWPYD